MTVPTEVILEYCDKHPKASMREVAKAIGTSFGDVQRTLAAYGRNRRHPQDVIGPKPFKKIPFAGSRGRQW
jgi:hypothetical protein